MSRYEELKKILKEHRYFKIVCGAGNEDCDEVYKLSLIYTLAGALGIDVSANVEVVKSSIRGINKAFELAPRLGKRIKEKPFVNVSIGMKGDPHIRKAVIDPDFCIQCGVCVENCLQKAISAEYKVIEKRCIGCGECARNCTAGAVKFFDKRNELKKILPECLRNGVETLELHAITADDQSVMEDWRLMNDILPDNFISMCLDRSQLSDAHLVKRIEAAREVTGERLIIQADGVPMSGGRDDYNTTLQAIAISDIIRKNNIQAMLLASGGTNSRSGRLANLCGVKINGVAVGTFARKTVSRYLREVDLILDMDLFSRAVSAAERLISSNLKEIGSGRFKDQ
ncbi:LdpA C-terminal domain-containing domain [Candidatus Omnitrophota bacterium]